MHSSHQVAPFGSAQIQGRSPDRVTEGTGISSRSHEVPIDEIFEKSGRSPWRESKTRPIQQQDMSTGQNNWPALLWLVRHGESAGNVARDQAERAGLSIIAIQDRDMDVPLSPLGVSQSQAAGRWFAALPVAEQPNVILASPYARAENTASIIANGLTRSETPLLRAVDERLREKEFGVLDRFTHAGIVERFPDQSELRSRLGKFYHRPPGGESWCDVILRLRSVVADIQLQHQGQRVLIVAHQVIVLCFRYLLERLSESQILQIDAAGDVANCSITAYRFAPDVGRLTLATYNHVAHLQEEGVPVTDHPDPPVKQP